MTMQTPTPLVHQSLDATNRMAAELVRFVENAQMTLDAPYQRGSVWSVRQQQDLVRSWLLGLPVPAIIINARYRCPGWDTKGHEYACIDGKQRIEAARAWFHGNLAVPASWFREEHIASTIETEDGPYVTHEHLTLSGQRYTSNRFMLPVAEARVEKVAQEAVIFGLVNGGGVPQDDETMARAAQIAADV